MVTAKWSPQSVSCWSNSSFLYVSSVQAGSVSTGVIGGGTHTQRDSAVTVSFFFLSWVIGIQVVIASL